MSGQHQEREHLSPAYTVEARGGDNNGVYFTQDWAVFKQIYRRIMEQLDMKIEAVKMGGNVTLHSTY